MSLPDLTRADRLREAARVLRSLSEREAGRWPCDDWTHNAIRHIARNCEIGCHHNEWDEATEEWIEHDCPRPDGYWDRYETSEFVKAMHPGVGLALADWLDAQGKHVGSYYCDAQCEPDGCDETKAALRLADLILGGAS